MADLTPSRIILQQEPTAFNAAVAEDNIARHAQAIQHHTLYGATIPLQWNINGPFGDDGAQVGRDLYRFMPWDGKLIAVFFSMEVVNGVVTTATLQKAATPAGSPTNLLSTSASFSAAAADKQRVGSRIEESPAGLTPFTAPNCTTPVINAGVNTFSAGECIYLDITATGFGASGLSATAWVQFT